MKATKHCAFIWSKWSSCFKIVID